MFLTLLAGTALSLQAAGQAAVRIPNLAPAPKGDQVLAKVGAVSIKADDIAAVLWEARGEEILSEFISYYLLKAQAEKQGVLVSDADVTRRLGEILKAQEAQLPPGTDPQLALNAEGMSAGRLFLNVKTELLMEGLVKLAFRPADYVKISTIIVRPKSEDPTEVAAATEKVNKAAARIKAGEAWEKVASEVIEEPSGKNNGGYLGWRSLDLFPAAIRNEIATMSPGGITGVVKTNFGVQMFRIEAQGKDATGETLEEMRNTARQAIQQKIVEDLRKNGKVERIPIVKPKS